MDLVLHDYFLVADGGGRLAVELARGLDLTLAYGFRASDHPYFPSGAPREIDLHARSDMPLVRQWRLIRAFRRFPFPDGARTAVHSGFYAPLAAPTFEGRNVFYCNTPPRFVYDRRADFRRMVHPLLRPAYDLYLRRYQALYERAVTTMDIIVANSENVRRRLRSFLGVSSQVIYPPCDTAAFRWIDQDDYYLSFSRLDPLKRVDLAIRAFRELPERRLVVVSSGPEEDRLRRLAAGAANIEVRGRVSQAQLREAIGRCVATIHLPRDEDFGLAPVESMSAGKPVIGVREGGLLETVVEGETGLLVDADPTPSEVAEAVLAMDSTRAAAMRRACEERAQAFDLHMFLGRMRDIITP